MKRINLTGKRFGRLVVRAYAGASKWSCVCDCGAQVVVRGHRLRGGITRSCGCRRRIVATKHDMHGSPEYQSWRGMKDRCSNPRHVAYDYYGGRGITVCEEWQSFEGFFADMGERPEGMTLDRIDNDGNYEPGNCRWSDRKLQSRNQRRPTRAMVKRRQRERAERLSPQLNDPPF